MKEKVNIICIYWTGDFRGRDFSPNDVRRLYQSVSKHADRPFDFYVLTNDMQCDVPGTKIELKHGDIWPGWWAKMELHRPDLPAGRTLYMDLDSHAIRSLQPILDYEGNLVMFPAQKFGNRVDTPDGLIIRRYQAATMLFDPGKFSWMYDRFKEEYESLMAKYRSEQDLMAEWIPDQPFFPKEWMVKMTKVYKSMSYQIVPPKEVIIVTGQPVNGGFRAIRGVRWFEKMARG